MSTFRPLSRNPRSRSALAWTVSLAMALGVAVPMTATAAPPPSAGSDSLDADRFRERQERIERARERREKMMNRIRALKTTELGELLELDSNETARLSQTLERFDEDRRRIQMENFEYMRALRQIAKGEAAGDAAELARRMAANRVTLAEIDQRELSAILDGLHPEQAAKASLFLTRFPRKMERLAEDVRRGRKHRRGDGEGEGRRNRSYRQTQDQGSGRR